MKTTIYLTRHGQTKWNVEGRLQGHLDSDLTETGLMHANLLLNRISDVEFDAIYSSTSDRAFKTAQLLNYKNLNIIKSDKIREMSFGHWEGKQMSDIEAQEPEALYNLFHNAPEYRSESGENYYDLMDRVGVFMTELLRNHMGETVLVVSHGITSKAILTLMDNRSIDTFWEGPFLQGCSLRLIHNDTSSENETNVVLHGDTEHLKIALDTFE